MVEKGEFIEFAASKEVVIIDGISGNSTEMQIMIEISKKIIELEERIIKLEK